MLHPVQILTYVMSRGGDGRSYLTVAHTGGCQRPQEVFAQAYNKRYQAVLLLSDPFTIHLSGTGGSMMVAESAMGKGDRMNTTIKHARCIKRTSGHTSKPSPKKSPKRSELTNRKRDDLVKVDMWDRATVAIGGFRKFMALPSR